MAFTGNTVTRVDTPSFTPASGGILSVVTPIETSGTMLLGVQYETDAGARAGFAALDPDECYKLMEQDYEDGLAYEDGLPFFVYRGIGCRLLGDSFEDAAERAKRALERDESRLIEQYLWENVFPDRAVDLTPGTGAVSPKLGLGLLLEAVALNYTGVPTIHFGKRAAVSLASESLLSQDEQEARTSGGAIYVSGSGYSSKEGPTTATGANEVWMYVTGQINLWRDPIDTRRVQDYVHNEFYALANRTYVATVETYVAAIRITLS